MAGLICPPDCLPQGLMMIAITVAPMANPISARRRRPLTRKCLTGEAGCCSSVANEQVENIYRLISPASIRYSGQCRRKLAATPKVSLTDAASGVLRGPVLFAASFTKSPLHNRPYVRWEGATDVSGAQRGSPRERSAHRSERSFITLRSDVLCPLDHSVVSNRT